MTDTSSSAETVSEMSSSASWDTPESRAAWPGDTGTLAIDSRRALAQIVQGPYLSSTQRPQLWSALRSDEAAIRSRLHDLFLDLVVDTEAGFAFVRNVAADDVDVPRVVRSQNLTFIDTALLLVLRQHLLSGDGVSRVFVDREDVYEQLSVFRTQDRDQTDFEKRLNSAWRKIDGLGLLHQVRGDGDDGRVEISPVLRLLIDPDQVRAIGAEYERLASLGGSPEDS